MTSVRHNARLTLEFVMWLGKRPNIVCKEEGANARSYFSRLGGLAFETPSKDFVYMLSVFRLFTHHPSQSFLSLHQALFLRRLEEYFGSKSSFSIIENMDSSCPFSSWKMGLIYRMLSTSDGTLS